MTSTTRYGFEHEKPERLAGIEVTWDPGTFTILERLGIREGMRCLEVGAGGGSVAAWMADRVGASGHVLATDLDTVHLDALASDVLEVRRHDLLADPLPDAAFDVIHARSVVSWMPRTDAIPRLVAALAPGGVLVLEDFDWAIGGPGEEDAPGLKAYDAILGLLDHIGYDRHFGRGLLARLEDAGLQRTASEARAYVVHGGSPSTAFERFSMLAQRDALLGPGGLTEDELAGALRYLEDPASHVLTPVLYAAWGTRT